MKSTDKSKLYVPADLAAAAQRLSDLGVSAATVGRYKAAKILNCTENQARLILEKLRDGKPFTGKNTGVSEDIAAIKDVLADSVLAALKQLKGKATLTDIADRLDRSPRVISMALESLRAKGHNVALRESGAVEISGDVAPGGQIVHPLSDYKTGQRIFGVCGDKHLGNRQARLDVLNALYDVYADEGITEVYDTGNWIDGEARFNKSELLVFGMDAQIDYWIDKHPKRNGVTTYFVAGDDHEGWYQQRECIEIGRYAEMRAKQAGREDLKYLGYVEAHIRLEAANGWRDMMVNHPGGGSAYAISYKGQKYVEMLQGGEKPAIVLQGHYHKANLSYPREVWVLDSGTCCDQTLFMRKKGIAAHVGGWIVRLTQAPDGRITRFAGEFLPFYDANYYTGQRRRFVA